MSTRNEEAIMTSATKGGRQQGPTKLTPFGQKCREIRKEKGLLLLDMAEAAEVTPGFLSMVETGRKPIPDGLVSKLVNGLDLHQRRAKELQNAAALSAREYRLTISDHPDPWERTLAFKLQDQFARMTPIKRQKIIEVLEDEE
ncbi:helix-turn-helix domain-containing protein [Altererythrobacter sp. Z27]|uniref:helix-turn-helix domain-containing protein n=1 Tax=Altererythrobacter sp. Z27 TaxID=3461147 RepID=UPI00404460A4